MNESIELAHLIVGMLKTTKARVYQHPIQGQYMAPYGPVVVSTTIWTDEEIESLKLKLSKLLK